MMQRRAGEPEYVRNGMEESSGDGRWDRQCETHFCLLVFCAAVHGVCEDHLQGAGGVGPVRA